jgi:hypothetical protein
MQAGPDFDTQLAHCIGGSACTPDALCRGLERDEETVSRGIDFPSPKPPDFAAHERVRRERRVRHRASPSLEAMSVEPTMSVNSTVCKLRRRLESLI